MPTNDKKIKTNLPAGRQEFDLDSLDVPSIDEVRSKIIKIVGERPTRSVDLSEGEWSEQAIKVLKERYLQKDEKGVSS